MSPLRTAQNDAWAFLAAWGAFRARWVRTDPCLITGERDSDSPIHARRRARAALISLRPWYVRDGTGAPVSYA